MYRFKNEPQDLADLFVDGLNLFGHGMKQVWVWALIAAMLGYIAPMYVVQPTIDYFSNTLKFSVNWTIFIAIIMSSVPEAFCVAMITRRLFVMGAKHHESNLGSMKVVIHKFIFIYAGLVAVATATVIGWLLFYIPAFIFSVTFIFTMPLILLDDYGLFRALRQSWNLVWDNFWRTVIMFSFPALIMAVNFTLPTDRMPLLINILQGVVMWFTLPLMLSFILTLFYDAKIRHGVPLHLEEEFVDEDWEGDENLATDPPMPATKKRRSTTKSTSKKSSVASKKAKDTKSVSAKSKVVKRSKSTKSRKS